MNCEQVFDRLTRGPFPSGDPADELVERHLLSCHECRVLAEALRPAVDLFHETLADEAAELPGYRGAVASITTALPTLAAAAPPAKLEEETDDFARPVVSPQTLARTLRMAGVLAVSLALLVWLHLTGVDESTSRPLKTAGVAAPAMVHSAAMDPSIDGQTLLAKLHLPPACFDKNDEYESAMPAAESLGYSGEAMEHYRCCTECHAKSAQPAAPAVEVATLTRSCQACHMP